MDCDMTVPAVPRAATLRRQFALCVLISTWSATYGYAQTVLDKTEKEWFVLLDQFEKCECINNQLDQCNLRKFLPSDEKFYSRIKSLCFDVGNEVINNHTISYSPERFKDLVGARSCTVYQTFKQRYIASTEDIVRSQDQCRPNPPGNTTVVVPKITP